MHNLAQEKKMSKTDRVLSLVVELLNTDGHVVHEDRLEEIIGAPSRAQKYRIIKEFLSGNEHRPPIIEKIQFSNKVYYGLSSEFRALLIK